MIPFAAGAVATSHSGGDQSVLPLAIWRTDDANWVDMEVTGPLTDGGKIMGLIDTTGQERHAVQSTSANRPLAEDDLIPGVFLAKFASGQSLASPDPGAQVVHAFMIVFVPTSLAGTRVLLTRDTSATTTKPAFAVQLG
jgi:hypothetical protein